LPRSNPHNGPAIKSATIWESSRSCAISTESRKRELKPIFNSSIPNQLTGTKNPPRVGSVLCQQRGATLARKHRTLANKIDGLPHVMLREL
jgi:hypothetical protein